MISVAGATLSTIPYTRDNDIRCRFIIPVTVIIAACYACGTYGADQSTIAGANKNKIKIKMDEPMTTEMMKQGMMKGDVKDAAAKKEKEMRPMMEQEEKSMPLDKPQQ